MRKRLGLPGNGLCCGQPNVTDLAQWLFCCVCSLCQEVRTGNLYEVDYHKLNHGRQYSQDQIGVSPRLIPSAHEQGSPALLPPAVNSPSCVNSVISPLNAEASVPPVLSPMHGSVGNSLPPQGSSLLQEGLSSPLSNSIRAEIHISIPSESESDDPHKEASQTENSKTDDDPMNAPIPLNLER